MGVNFTDISATGALIAATFNNPLDELDQEIEDMKDGSAALSAPTITAFTNATHDHADAAGGGQLDWDDIWSDAVHDHSSAAEGGSNLGQSAPIFINETANAKMTLGLTINQGANDDEILTLKSSDVDHGMTDLAETDTYGTTLKTSGDGGGLSVIGLTDLAAPAYGALNLFGYLGENADTAKTTAGHGIIRLYASIKSGTGKGGVNADGNLVTIEDNGTTQFIFDVEGSAHGNVEWTTFDEYDDVTLLGDFEAAMLARRDPVKAEFADFLRYSPDELEAARIVTFDPENPDQAMVNFTRLAMLHTGAIRQLAARLERYEQALLDMGLNPELLEAAS